MEHVTRPRHARNGNGHHKNGNGTGNHTLPAELTRLISVAIISDRFRDLLLRDPERALDAGFHGQQFTLTPEQRDLVLSIQAVSLTDFAAQLTDFAAQLTHIPVGAETAEAR